MAQKAEVDSFEPVPMDVTAQQHSRLDLHGEKCAVVKVRVIADDVAFKGNLIGEPVEIPGEYWIYLTDGTKQVQILSRSFLPFMYYFAEPLKGGVTYVLTLQAPQNGATPQRKKLNFLALKVTPVSARVILDGEELPLENGGGSKLLDAGTHTFRVTATGYAPYEETVTIAGQKVTRTVTLQSIKPHLSIAATTPGTEIYVNDERKGTDSWSGEMFSDTYVIEGRLNARSPFLQTITLSDNESRTVTIPALTPITGMLSIDYKPLDAAVSVDGRAAGVTPLLLDSLLIGTHSVTISAPGYSPATVTATVTESAPATLTGSLTALPVYTGPTPADIALTKKYKWFKDPVSGKYGYKHNGNIVIPAKYDNAWTFSGGLAAVKINGKWGFIDKTGTIVITAIYDDADFFQEGLVRVKTNGKWGYVDNTGVMVIPAIYDEVESFFDGMAIVRIDGQYGFIDKTGNLAIPAKYDYAQNFREGLAAVGINNKRGYIDKSGTLVIPAKYDGYASFCEGLALVQINGKLGFIDKAGKLVIPAKYDDAESFYSGKARVLLNGRRFYIDRNGNEVQ